MKIGMFAFVVVLGCAMVGVCHWLLSDSQPSAVSQTAFSTVPPVPAPQTTSNAPAAAPAISDASQREIVSPSLNSNSPNAVSSDYPTAQYASQATASPGFFESTWWLLEFCFAVIVGPMIALGGGMVFVGRSRSYTPSGNWTGTTDYWAANPNPTAGKSGGTLLGLWLVGIFVYYFVARFWVPELTGFWRALGKMIDSAIK